jgi:hypothetical protein
MRNVRYGLRIQLIVATPRLYHRREEDIADGAFKKTPQHAVWEVGDVGPLAEGRFVKRDWPILWYSGALVDSEDLFRDWWHPAIGATTVITLSVDVRAKGEFARHCFRTFPSVDSGKAGSFAFDH